MKHLLAFTAALGLLVTPFGLAQAQTVTAVTVASCGTPPNTPIVGGTYPVLMDQTGKLCTSGTGGGGGGAVTAVSGAYVDGSIIGIGGLGDTAWASGNGSLIAINKSMATSLAAISAGTATSATLPVYVQGSTAQAAIQADKSAFLNDANATATQIVALSGSTKIYVSSYSIVAAAAENVKFQYGTGSNCGTGTTDITSLMALSANGGIARGNGTGNLFIVPAGNALCVTASTTGPTAVDVSYAQF